MRPVDSTRGLRLIADNSEGRTDARRSNWPYGSYIALRSLRTGRSYRPRLALSALRSGRPYGPYVALRSLRAGRSYGSRLALSPLRSGRPCGSLCSLWPLRPLIALIPFRTSRDGK